MHLLRVAKYILTGGIGITVNLGSYTLLVHFLHTPLLTGSIIAVSISTIVGFVLQKFWTFEERTTDTASIQFAQYVALALVNIILNTAIVYVLEAWLTVYYLAAQFFAGAIVAIWSYFLYREVIFKKRESSAL